jgi:hypothetical protein
MKTQAEDGHLQAKEKGLEHNPQNLRLQTSKTMK